VTIEPLLTPALLALAILIVGLAAMLIVSYRR
jgi:hypothetical protein